MRVTPALPPQHMKTYSILAPIGTHFRAGTCEEAGCQHFLNGWMTIVPAGSVEESTVRSSRRHFTEEPREGGLIEFRFEAGQNCFRAHLPECFRRAGCVLPPATRHLHPHWARVERPELMVVRDGDHRGNPRGTKPRIHNDPQTWVDDFGEHQERLADRRERG